jgi:hypothetical protein
MIRTYLAASLVFLTSACAGKENATRFQGVIEKAVPGKAGEAPVRGWIYLHNVDLEGITFDVAEIQWTDETKCFLLDGQSRKPADMASLKPAMTVEVKLASKLDNRLLPMGAPAM